MFQNDRTGVKRTRPPAGELPEAVYTSPAAPRFALGDVGARVQGKAAAEAFAMIGVALGPRSLALPHGGGTFFSFVVRQHRLRWHAMTCSDQIMRSFRSCLDAISLVSTRSRLRLRTAAGCPSPAGRSAAAGRR